MGHEVRLDIELNMMRKRKKKKRAQVVQRRERSLPRGVDIIKV